MAKDKIQDLKLNSYDLIMASPKYAKLLSEASKSPIGSTTRSRAQSLLKTINKTYQQQILDQDPMLKMSYIAANKGLSGKVLNKKDGKGGFFDNVKPGTPEANEALASEGVPAKAITPTKTLIGKSVPPPAASNVYNTNIKNFGLQAVTGGNNQDIFNKNLSQVGATALLGATPGTSGAQTYQGDAIPRVLKKAFNFFSDTFKKAVTSSPAATFVSNIAPVAPVETPKNTILPSDLLADGSTTVTNPDETSATTNPDETSTTTNPDESITTTSPSDMIQNIPGGVGVDNLATYAWNNPDLANRWQNLSEAQRSQLQDVFLAVDSNMGPEMFSYLTTNDKKAFKRLFPNVPEEYMPNGATYTTGWGALTNTAEQKTKMETLESKLSTMMNTMGPDATLLKPTMEEYIRTKDEYRANLQDLKKQATQDWIDNPWAGDATVDREAEKYINFLDTLDNRQKQRYADFVDRSYNQYLGTYNQINNTYSILSTNIKEQLARKDKNMVEIKAALKDMYAQVKNAEAYDLAMEQDRINVKKGYNDLVDVKNKDIERDFFKFEDKIKGQFGIVNDKQSLRDAITNDISSIIANNSTDPYSIQNVAETWNNITKSYGNTAGMINDPVFHQKNNEVMNQYTALMNSALTKANNASLSEKERQYALSSAGLYQKALQSIENTYKNTYYNALIKTYNNAYSTNKMSDKKNIVNILDDQKSKIFKVADNLTVPSSTDISANQQGLNTAVANAIQQFKTSYAKEYNKIKTGLGGYGIAGQYVDDLLGDIIYTRYIAKSDFKSPSELYIAKQVKDTTDIDKSLKNITTVDLLKALANTSIFGANNQ